jgi:hypothetical protein
MRPSKIYGTDEDGRVCYPAVIGVRKSGQMSHHAPKKAKK